MAAIYVIIVVLVASNAYLIFSFSQLKKLFKNENTIIVERQGDNIALKTKGGKTILEL